MVFLVVEKEAFFSIFLKIHNSDNLIQMLSIFEQITSEKLYIKNSHKI